MMLLISYISMIMLDTVGGTGISGKSDALYDLLSVMGGVAAILAIVIFIYKIGIFVQEHIGRIKHLEEDSEKNIRPSIEKIDQKIDQRLIPAINEINSGMSYLKGAMGQILTQDFVKAQSPKSLNDKGTKILKDSGVDMIVDEQFNKILAQVRAKGPVNAYQAQEVTVEVVKNLSTVEELKNDLEMGSFRSGYDIDIILYVGAFYIRDRILDALGLLPDDIDKDDPSVSKPQQNL